MRAPKRFRKTEMIHARIESELLQEWRAVLDADKTRSNEMSSNLIELIRQDIARAQKYKRIGQAKRKRSSAA